MATSAMATNKPRRPSRAPATFTSRFDPPLSDGRAQPTEVRPIGKLLRFGRDQTTVGRQSGWLVGEGRGESGSWYQLRYRTRSSIGPGESDPGDGGHSGTRLDAKSGRVSRLGPSGRSFKSCLPDVPSRLWSGLPGLRPVSERCRGRFDPSHLATAGASSPVPVSGSGHSAFRRAEYSTPALCSALSTARGAGVTRSRLVSIGTCS